MAAHTHYFGKKTKKRKNEKKDKFLQKWIKMAMLKIKKNKNEKNENWAACSLSKLLDRSL